MGPSKFNFIVSLHMISNLTRRESGEPLSFYMQNDLLAMATKLLRFESIKYVRRRIILKLSAAAYLRMVS